MLSYVVFKALENDHVCGVSDSEALTESELDVTSDTFSDSSKNYQVRTRGKRSVLNFHLIWVLNDNLINK